jgi:hypothetical protein
MQERCEAFLREQFTQDNSPDVVVQLALAFAENEVKLALGTEAESTVFVAGSNPQRAIDNALDWDVICDTLAEAKRASHDGQVVEVRLSARKVTP